MKSNNKRLGYLVSILFLISLIFSKYLFIESDAPSVLFSTLAHPFLILEAKFTDYYNNYTNNHRTNKELSEQVKKNEELILKLSKELIEIRAQIDHYKNVESLINFLNRFKLDNSNSLIAQIIYKNLDKKEHFIFIDSGSEDGLSSEMVAIHNNSIIGKISKVYKHWSKVQLITDPKCKIAAFIARSGDQAIHEGNCQKDLTKLNFLSHLSDVKIGDLILSSGQGFIFPRGFGLAYVQSIILDGLYHKVDCQPITDISKLDYCIILKRCAEINFAELCQ